MITNENALELILNDFFNDGYYIVSDYVYKGDMIYINNINDEADIMLNIEQIEGIAIKYIFKDFHHSFNMGYDNKTNLYSFEYKNQNFGGTPNCLKTIRFENKILLEVLLNSLKHLKN